MKNHPTPESLSALIDDELGKRERAQIEEHLTSCVQCSEGKQELHRASSALRSLPGASITREESQKLLKAVMVETTRARPAPSTRAWWTRRRLAPGLAAAAALAAAGAWLSTSPGQDPRPAPPEVVASGSLRVEDASSIRRVVQGLPQVREALGRYSAGALERNDEEPGRSAQERTLESTDGSRAAPADGADSTAAPEDAVAPPVTMQPDEFSRSAGLACLDKIAATQRYPVLPLVARRAEFRGQPAWLLIYAWTSSEDPDAKLDQIQVWVVTAPDCADLSGPGLLNRVLHYSAF